MKKYYIYSFIIIIFFSCENSMPGFRFSNFDNTPAKNLAKAVRNNNIKEIRNEIIKRKINIDYPSKTYGSTLLSLAIVNKKKEAFDELLKLGANPNYYRYNYCSSPLIESISYADNCDLYYITKLLDYGAKITSNNYYKCNNIIVETPLIVAINKYNLTKKTYCTNIIKLLASRVDIDLNKFNDNVNCKYNVIYNCLDARNMKALKYFIIDLKLEVPKKIYIDEYITGDLLGFVNLKHILSLESFNFKYSRKKNIIKNEILEFLEKKGNGTD